MEGRRSGNTLNRLIFHLEDVGRRGEVWIGSSGCGLLAIKAMVHELDLSPDSLFRLAAGPGAKRGQ